MSDQDRLHPSLGDDYPLIDLMRAVLEKGRPFRYEARGESMVPTIRDGDAVTVSPLGVTSPKTGDIVAFAYPVTGGLRVHRIVRTGPGGYLLKGDNALAADGELPRDRILGIIVRVERGGRALSPGSGLRAAAVARLSRTFWFTRVSRRVRRALGRGDGRT